MSSSNIGRALNVLSCIVLGCILLPCGVAFGQEDFSGWNLESSVAQAHLIMVARVASVGQVTMVEGAKTDVALREYRFEPVRILKGLFHRDQLSMTASDLGLGPEDGRSPAPLKEGEFRLLILTQQSSGGFPNMPTFGCVAAAPGVTSFAERVPLVSGPDDPLTGIIETLIQVVDSRSRREQAKLLVDRLSSPPLKVVLTPNVPVLTSLRSRADWAAADENAYKVLAPLARSEERAVRGAALNVIHDMLASGAKTDHPEQLDGIAEALRDILNSDEADTHIRVTAIESLGSLLALKVAYPWADDVLIKQLTSAATNAERSAALTMLSRTDPDPKKDTNRRAIFDAASALPLDVTPEQEAIYANALERLMPSALVRQMLGDLPPSERILLKRLKQSLAAGQPIAVEARSLGQIRSAASLPILLSAANSARVADNDRQAIAIALGRIKDNSAVPLLAAMLRGNGFSYVNLKEVALSSLENIDSPVAAAAIRPLLKTEPSLDYKLRIARLVARHQIADGYSLATEHLADPNQTAQAALVLAALNDPRTSQDLTAILSSQPSRQWHAAALIGLVATGDAAAKKELLQILADERNPLTVGVVEAAGLSDDADLLPPLTKLIQSRNKQIAKASLLALRRFLSDVRSSPRGLAAKEFVADEPSADDNGDGEGQPSAPAAKIPAATRTVLAEAMASVVEDPYVDAELRTDAFMTARLLRGERFDKMMSTLADQVELEGTPLLNAVQAERRRSSNKLANR